MVSTPWQKSWIEQRGTHAPWLSEKSLLQLKTFSGSRRRIVTIAAILSCLFLWFTGALLFSPPPTSYHIPESTSQSLSWQSSSASLNLAPPPSPQKLHLLLPGNQADENLCKAMLSASILGYPAPVLVNWNQSFHTSGQVAGGSHLAKISGIYNWLDALDKEQDEDLVLIVDGYDVWLQLRPQTVIDRYFEIIRRADQRIAGEMGKAMKLNDIRSEVVFGCQKRCWPWTTQDPPCYAVPESDLPKDIYGPNTDKDLEDEDYLYVQYRQRFLNSGISMGTVRALKKLFAQAMRRIEKESNFGSDQLILSHIYGDQEVWREILRRRYASWWERKLEAWGWSSNAAFLRFQGQEPDHLVQVAQKASERADGTYEFGIGIDFGSAIGINTVFAEDDTEWLKWNELSALERKKAAGLVSADISRVRELAPDITGTTPPFLTLTQQSMLPRWKQWADVPLLTDLWTGNVPAVIHHNAHKDGRKALRTTWWNETWYAAHVRDLFDASLLNPGVSLGLGGYDSRSTREWWPADRRTGGGRSDAKVEDGASNWVPFEDMCKEHHKEIFRDDKGSWRPTKAAL